MKIYKDLIIKGSNEALKVFEASLSHEIPNYWKYSGEHKKNA